MDPERQPASNKPYLGAFYLRDEACYRIIEATGPSTVSVKGVDEPGGKEWTTTGEVFKKGLALDYKFRAVERDVFGRIIGAGAIRWEWPKDDQWERLLSWKSAATPYLGKYVDATNPQKFRTLEPGAVGTTSKVLLRGADVQEGGDFKQWTASGSVTADGLVLDLSKMPGGGGGRNEKATLMVGGGLQFSDKSGTVWKRLPPKEYINEFARLHDIQAKLTVVLNELVFDEQFAAYSIPEDPLKRFAELLMARISGGAPEAAATQTSRPMTAKPDQPAGTQMTPRHAISNREDPRSLVNLETQMTPRDPGDAETQMTPRTADEIETQTSRPGTRPASREGALVLRYGFGGEGAPAPAASSVGFVGSVGFVSSVGFVEDHFPNPPMSPIGEDGPLDAEGDEGGAGASAEEHALDGSTLAEGLARTPAEGEAEGGAAPAASDPPAPPPEAPPAADAA